MKNANYLMLFMLLFRVHPTLAGCAQFETALEVAMRRTLAREEVKTLRATWGSEEAQKYVSLYGKNTTSGEHNRTFMKMVDSDKGDHAKDVLYFSTENSIQKLLNDKIIGRKDVVDSINNSMFQKLEKHLNDFPELKAFLSAKNIGFKDRFFRVKLAKGDDKTLLEGQLAELYRRANLEFADEFERMGLSKLIPPRTDGAHDPSTWFLAGIGDSALEANQAARWARKLGFQNGNARAVKFREIAEMVQKEVNALEGLRASLAANADLVKAGLMVKLPTGEVIPSREMIDILRRTKLADCDGVADFLIKFKAKVKTQFNTDIKDPEIDQFTQYFEKVDSLSPPIFERERVVINLGDAKDDIISVDFTGIGVDNAEAQMKALASVNFLEKDRGKFLQQAYDKIQAGVDEVTHEMNMAKRFFSEATKGKPQFSGDDGILMPVEKWTMDRKEDLVKFLAKFKDPSKFRVTTTRTTNKGKVIPKGERSAGIVRAEKVEKGLREDVVGALKIPNDRAKKMIFAIDYKDGKFNLILGGQKPTDAERVMILESFKKSIEANKGSGDKLGDIIEAFN